MDSNICRHPVNHSGTAQTDRLLKTLVPGNFRLDNRQTEDFMVYIARFAKNIRFWKSSGDHNGYGQLEPDGDWSEFWECDHLFFLASVAAIDIESFERRIRKNVIKILELAGEPDSGHECDPDECAAEMRKLIDLIFELASVVNGWGEKSKSYPALQSDFKAAISDDLIGALRSLISFDKETPVQENNYDNFIYDCTANAFAPQWKLSRKDYIKIDFINPCEEAYVSARRLERNAKEFLKALFRLRERAKGYFELEQNGENRRHQPHIALFFSFMHLFRYLTDQLNELPQHHLDHYYERILHLERRNQLPDQTHLVFQLAQGVARHTLENQTAFRAGKDAAGRELFYGLEKPLSLNQAKVVEIKTLYVSDDMKSDGSRVTACYENTILDTDKTTPAPDKIDQVRPFYALGKGGEQEKMSVIGFGISSAEFLTSKASRTIRVFLELENFPDISNSLSSENKGRIQTLLVGIGLNLAQLFKIEISTTEGWVELDGATVGAGNPSNALDGTSQLFPVRSSEANDNDELSKYPDTRAKDVDILGIDGSNGLCVSVTIQLGKSVAATASPLPARDGMSAQWPVLKVNLQRNSPFLDQKDYELLLPLVLQARVSSVFVASLVTDVTDFEVIEASTGIRLPSSKNIELSRYVEQGLIIRAPEILKRQLVIGKNGDTEPCENLTNVQVEVSNGNKSQLTLFEDNREVSSPAILNRNFKKDRYLLAKGFPEPQEPVVELLTVLGNADHVPDAPQLERGTVSSRANRPIYGDLTITYQSYQLIFLAGNSKDPKSVLFEPAAAAAVKPSLIDDNYDQMLYLLPHQGYQEIKTLHVVSEAGKSSFPLLRPLTAPVPSGSAIPNGNLFIGLKALEPLQTLSMLFQVADGTEDIYDKQTPDIEWSYLAKNAETGMDEWRRFPSSAVLTDQTKADPGGKKSLVQSGIVELSIPKHITAESTILKPGFHWIRASALEVYQKEEQVTNVLSLPKLIAIHAQAGKVVLLTNDVAGSHFKSPLPVKTISALRQRQSAILKTDQFYSGFGGRAFEPDTDFYRRISERLRHRRRAVTAWDYERLVLEHFPEIRAVKCLQHTHEDKVCANGHITVAVLPFLRNPEFQQPLQPNPSMALLENVKSFLRKKTNLFVADIDDGPDGYLHIVRPGYEQVAVLAKVRFRTDGFADQETLMFRLDEDIASYISPWAFDNTQPPRFGNVLYRTDLLCHLETLPYVDYIETLLIGIADRTDTQVVFDFGTPSYALLTPDSPAGMLTSFMRLANDTADTAAKLPDEYVFSAKNDYTPHHLIQVL